MNFDERVWQLLKRIPRGKVTSYKAIAAALGKPNAARAVGNACNRNPNAPRVPCHRVVRSSGELGGFAGGSAEKARLLRREGIMVKNNRVPELSKHLIDF